MVTTEKEEGIGIPDLQTPKVEYTLWDRCSLITEMERALWITHLNTEVSSIDIITQKQISRGGGATADFKEFHKIVL